MATLMRCARCGASFQVRPYRASTAKFCSRRCAGTDVDLSQRFWSKVDIRGDDECWLWRASFGTTGYGQFTVAGAPRKAHRVAFELANGDASGMGVLHRCDNPPCCNPKHLFLGTQADNMADMRSKGRGGNKPAKRGELHHNAKLSAEAVREILSSSESGASLGRKFGVTSEAIYMIRRGVNWRHAA